MQYYEHSNKRYHCRSIYIYFRIITYTSRRPTGAGTGTTNQLFACIFSLWLSLPDDVQQYHKKLYEMFHVSVVVQTRDASGRWSSRVEWVVHRCSIYEYVLLFSFRQNIIFHRRFVPPCRFIVIQKEAQKNKKMTGSENKENKECSSIFLWNRYTCTYAAVLLELIHTPQGGSFYCFVERSSRRRSRRGSVNNTTKAERTCHRKREPFLHICGTAVHVRCLDR